MKYLIDLGGDINAQVAQVQISSWRFPEPLKGKTALSLALHYMKFGGDSYYQLYFPIVE